MNFEYESLRNEIHSWQSRRFTILAASISLITGILGIDAIKKGGPSIEWPLISSLLWFFIGSASSLTWYAGCANKKIAAYIILYHEKEEGWESRLASLKKSGFDWYNLNRMLFIIYFGLSLLALLIPWAVRKGQVIDCWNYLLLSSTGIWLVFSLCLLTLNPPLENFKNKWKDAS